MMSTNADTIGPAEPDARPPAPDEAAEADDGVEELAEAYDFEENGLKWLRAIAPIIEGYSGVDRRVQLALDFLVIAACERGCRILHSDLPPTENL